MANFKVVACVYAIRHEPSGRYMPTTKRNRGYTQIEPEEFSPFGKSLPRLFESRSKAGRARDAWLKGPHLPVREDASWEEARFGATSYVVGCRIPETPPPNRRPEDIEIVEFRLEEL